MMKTSVYIDLLRTLESKDMVHIRSEIIINIY